MLTHQTNKMIGVVDVVACLGDRVISNSELEKNIELGENYIFRRTGINNRYYKAKEKSFLDLAIASVNKLLSRANVSPSEISALVCASTTFDVNSPSLACQILNHIDPNMTNNDCFALDINAACSGYVYALSVAKNQLLSIDNKKRFAVVVTNEVFSDYLGNSASSDILFGDASSATLLEVSNSIEDSWKALLQKFHLGSVRDKKNSIRIFAEDGIGKMTMDGFFVFENAVKTIIYSTEKLLKLSDTVLEDIDIFIPHQANIKIIETISRKMGIEKNKLCITLDKYGNTGASSIPLCLAELLRESKQESKNSKIKGILTSFGSGFTFGSVLIEIMVPISE